MTYTELKAAFLNTDYNIVDDRFPRGIFTLKAKHYNEDLRDYFSDLKTWAFITAWNPLPDILSDEVNADRNKRLAKDINTIGLNYHSAYGISKDRLWKEDSFFIENISRDQAIQLGIKYGQKAIVYSEAELPSELIFCFE